MKVGKGDSWEEQRGNCILLVLVLEDREEVPLAHVHTSDYLLDPVFLLVNLYLYPYLYPSPLYLLPHSYPDRQTHHAGRDYAEAYHSGWEALLFLLGIDRLGLVLGHQEGEVPWMKGWIRAMAGCQHRHWVHPALEDRGAHRLSSSGRT